MGMKLDEALETPNGGGKGAKKNRIEKEGAVPDLKSSSEQRKVFSSVKHCVG